MAQTCPNKAVVNCGQLRSPLVATSDFTGDFIVIPSASHHGRHPTPEKGQAYDIIRADHADQAVNRHTGAIVPPQQVRWSSVPSLEWWRPAPGVQVRTKRQWDQRFSTRNGRLLQANPTYKNAVWCAHRPFGLLDEVQHFFDCSIQSISGQLVDPRQLEMPQDSRMCQTSLWTFATCMRQKVSACLSTCIQSCQAPDSSSFAAAPLIRNGSQCLATRDYSRIASAWFSKTSQHGSASVANRAGVRRPTS